MNSQSLEYNRLNYDCSLLISVDFTRLRRNILSNLLWYLMLAMLHYHGLDYYLKLKANAFLLIIPSS